MAPERGGIGIIQIDDFFFKAIGEVGRGYQSWPMPYAQNWWNRERSGRPRTVQRDQRRNHDHDGDIGHDRVLPFQSDLQDPSRSAIGRHQGPSLALAGYSQSPSIKGVPCASRNV